MSELQEKIACADLIINANKGTALNSETFKNTIQEVDGASKL